MTINKSNRIMNGTIRLYVLSNILSNAADLLNNLVDGAIASGMLGEEALSMISIAMPVTTLVSTLRALLAIGGAASYATFLGQGDKNRADRCLTLSMLSMLVLGVLAAVAGAVFIRPFAIWMGATESMREVFVPFLRWRFISIPIVLMVCGASSFLPALSLPKLGAVLVAVSTGSNLLLDWLLLRFTGLGLQGTVIATITGNLIAMLVLLFKLGKSAVRPRFVRIGKEDMAMYGSIVKYGIGTALNRFGIMIRLLYFNHAALALGGAAGLLAYAIVEKVGDFCSMFYRGCVDATIPLTAMLRGQHDYTGAKMTLRKLLLITEIICMVFVSVLLLFPGIMTGVYSVSAEMRPEIWHAIRVNAVHLLLRPAVLLYLTYRLICGNTVFSVAMRLFDMPFGLLGFSLLMTGPFRLGTDGLWLAQPVTTLAAAVLVLLLNAYKLKKNPDRYETLLLHEKEMPGIPQWNVSLANDVHNLGDVGRDLSAFLQGLDMAESVRSTICRAVISMAVFIQFEQGKGEMTDIVMRREEQSLIVVFRSSGKPYDPFSDVREGNKDYFDRICRMVSKAEYNFTMGLNVSMLTIGAEGSTDPG